MPNTPPTPDPATATATRLARAASLWTWTGQARPSFATKPQPTQESVWDYPRPPPLAPYGALRGYVALYPTNAECLVNGERVRPQDGGFYGGWVTNEIVGPWKGGPGSGGW